MTVQPSWRIHHEDHVGFWVHPLRKTLFRRRLIPDSSLGSTEDCEYVIFWTRRTWYNTTTREFDVETITHRTFDDILAEGRAIYDWRTREFIVPEGADPC